MKHSSTTTFVALVGLLSLLACGPCSGILDDESFFFVEGEWAIVMGSTSTLEVFVSNDNDPIDPISPQGVTPVNPSVVSVTSVQQNAIEIEAVEPGETDLQITVIDPLTNESQTFIQPIAVIEPEYMKLDHCIASDGRIQDVVHARGFPALVGFRFVARGVSGQGKGFYPIEVSPPEAGVLVEEESDELELAVLIAEDSVDPVTVSTTLDLDPPSQTPRELRIIDADEITEVVLDNTASFAVGNEEELRVKIYAGDRIVCSKMPLRLEIKTPGVCSFRQKNGMESTLIENTKTVPRINTKAIGACQIIITLVAAGVAAISSTTDIEVFQPEPPTPSGGGGGGDFD